MSGPDDRIRRGLERLVEPGDPSGAFDRVARRRRRYAVRRRAGSALLSMVVVGGAVGGFLGLRDVFGPADQVAGSGRSGLIAFVGNEGNLYLISPDGTGRRRLTAGPDLEHGPSWSHDGERLAYVSMDDDAHASVHVWNSRSGETTTAALPVQGSLSDPAWAASGEVLAFTDTEGGLWVWRVPRDGGGGQPQRVLTSGFTVDSGGAAWSPLGAQLLVSGRVGSESHLFKVSVATGDGPEEPRIERVTTTGHPNRAPHWALDGSIWYLSGNDVVRSGSSEPRPEALLHDVRSFSVSPSSSRVAYVTGRGDRMELFVRGSEAGAGEPTLISHGAWPSAGAWSFDETALAFTRLSQQDDDRGPVELVVADVDTGRTTTIATGLGSSSVTWQPVPSPEPIPGPTSSATASPGEELTFWEICADAPFPHCQWVANVLDRAGFSPTENTGGALVGEKSRTPEVTIWATEWSPSDQDPVEPPKTDGASCDPPYRELRRIAGVQVCTDGVRHMWLAGPEIVWVTAGQFLGAPLIQADDLEPLVRASMSVDASDPSHPEPSIEILGGGVFGGFCHGVCDTRVVLSGGTIEIIHTERCAPVAPTGVTDESCDPPIVANTGRLTEKGLTLLSRLTSAADPALRPEHNTVWKHGRSRIPTDGADTWIELRRGEVRSTHIFGDFERPPQHFRIAQLFIWGVIDASWECAASDLVRFGPDCVPVPSR